MRFQIGQELPCCEVIAKNYGADHANRIHSDEGAARYGFAGALVPGVGLYAYLTRPVVGALGREWLERGAMSAKFIKPVYDGEKVQARATIAHSDPAELKLELINQSGELCAIGSASLPDSSAALNPDAYPFRALAQAWTPSIASFSIGDALGSFEFDLDMKGEMPKFLDNVVESSPIYDSICHPAFWIAQANEILMRNITLGPWIHTASDARHKAMARDGERLSLRGRVIDLYERRGHELVVVDLGLFGETGRTVAHIKHTAIIKLREAGE
ncbi:MAG: MaoC family dehydratase [Blastocatellia bacterium]|nr:MaoC family dehydratase [Blastocatellia bacterium]